MTTNPFATALGTATTNNSEAKITITKHHLKKKNKLSMQSAHICIRNETAYIASQATTIDRYTVSVAPVLNSPVEVKPLTLISEKILFTTESRISEEEAVKIIKGKKPKDAPILQATGSSSYLNLRRNSVSYSIQRYEDDWLLFLPGENEKDESVRLVFPQTTPVKELVQIIIDDYWQKRRDKK